MKVLLVGEGASELAGALATLVRRLGLQDAQIDHDRVSRPDLHAFHGKGQGYFKRAVRWLRDANKRGYDALVLLIDEDGKTDRSPQFTKAQNYEDVPLPRALGVAIRSFDAWFLADEKALTQVLSSLVSRQPDPESISAPKQRCNDLLQETSSPLEIVEMYAQVATVVDLEMLRNRCPKGFRPFSSRVEALCR